MCPTKLLHGRCAMSERAVGLRGGSRRLGRCYNPSRGKCQLNIWYDGNNTPSTVIPPAGLERAAVSAAPPPESVGLLAVAACDSSKDPAKASVKPSIAPDASSGRWTPRPPPPLGPILPPEPPSPALAAALAREVGCSEPTALEFLRSGLAPARLRESLRAALWRPIHQHEARRTQGVRR
jgi:hypothetical protein